tara:strand:+ start:4171 stop:5385 length:1215 start_codon:yes stop_codon:yes gene_type:complete
MQKKTVLLVDDSIVDRIILDNQLKLMGLKTIICKNGEDAVELCIRYLPDIVLMDLHMPGIGGAEAIQRIKRSLRDRTIPVILVSGLIKEEDLLQGLSAGADDFIQKPINPIFLQHKVLSLIDTENKYNLKTNKLSIQYYERNLHSVLREIVDISTFAGFSVVYQPVVEMSSGNIIEIEAFLRWNSPIIGKVSPSDFISVAEKTGRMGELTKFLLVNVAEFIQRLEKSGFSFPISINMSFSEVISDEFSEKTFIKNLDDLNISCSQLKLEFCESFIMANSPTFKQKLMSLLDIGLSLTIDNATIEVEGLEDFTPFKTVKMEKINFGRNSKEVDIKRERSIINSISNKRMYAVSKSIETLEEADFLQSMGFRFGQGLFYCAPLPSDKIIAFVQSFAPIKVTPQVEL